MNWIDIAIIVILLVNVFIGWSRGFIRSVTNLISVVLGFLMAKFYHPQMYSFLNEKFDLLEKIRVRIGTSFTNIEFPDTQTLMSVSPKELSETVGQTEYLQKITEKFFESDQFKTMLDNNVQNFSNGFSSWLADNLLTILSMVLVFTIVFIGVRILGYALSGIFKLPLLNGVNKLSGFLFGLGKGVFIAMLFVLVIVIIGPFFDQGTLIETLEQSQIGIYFYKYNIVMMIFESML
ncbi:MAG: CvpA family protein [Clostridia bacterium]|nr:CvpA family protein [Clostridia bacterium]